MAPALIVHGYAGEGGSRTGLRHIERVIGRHDMKIFLVEDSAAIRERLAEMIGDISGAKVVGEAESFKDAMAGIERTHPDVVVLDIKLADDEGTGIDVLDQVKRTIPAVRAIMLTNYATPQHVKASAGAGAEYFLDKSADFEKIVEILEGIRDTGSTAGGKSPA